MGKQKKKRLRKQINIVGRTADAIGGFVHRVRVAADNNIALSHYDAAKKDRTNRDWRAALTSADQAILDDLDTMMARSRAMIRNDGYAASAQGAYRRYVVGGGITARSAAKHPDTNEMLKGFNAAVDGYWNEWYYDPELCDAERTKTMPEKQAVWMNELFAIGGVCIVMNYIPKPDNVGLVLQEIEYEQLDQLMTENNGHPVRDGIEVDEFGGPLMYHLHTISHPLEEYATKSRPVPASQCIHIFRQDRVRQKHGTPWMTAVLPPMRNLSMYERYMTIKARNEAAYTGFIKQTGQSSSLPNAIAARIGAPKPSGETASETPDELQVRVEPGMFPILKDGQDVAFPQPASPNSQYNPFVTEQLKRISAGTGLDLATVARWYADGNFSSQQMAKMEMWAETDAIQSSLFVNKAMKRIRRQYIEIALREKRFKATGYWESPRWRRAYLAANWKGPPKPQYQKAKDAAYAKLMTGMGYMSPQDHANERGRDIREIYAEIAEAREMRREYKIDDLIDPVFHKVDPTEPRPGKKPADEEKKAGNNGSGGSGDLSSLLTERIIMQGVFGNNGDDGE